MIEWSLKTKHLTDVATKESDPNPNPNPDPNRMWLPKELDAKNVVEARHEEQIANYKAQINPSPSPSPSPNPNPNLNPTDKAELEAGKAALHDLEAEIRRKSEMLEKVHQDVRLYTHSLESSLADLKATT